MAAGGLEHRMLESAVGVARGLGEWPGRLRAKMFTVGASRSPQQYRRDERAVLAATEGNDLVGGGAIVSTVRILAARTVAALWQGRRSPAACVATSDAHAGLRR